MLQENVVKDIIVWIEQNLDSRLSLDIIAENQAIPSVAIPSAYLKAYTGISLRQICPSTPFILWRLCIEDHS